MRRFAKRNFITDEGGNTFMIFGLAFVPVMFMMGAATDYTRLTISKAALQQGTDAAALAVASKMTNDTTVEQAKKQAQVLLNANPQNASATITNVTISNDKQTLCADSKISISNTFMKLAQMTSMTANVNSCASLAGGVDPETTYEIALVLDNSGSMSSSAGGVSKMQALRTSATSFVNTMYSKSNNVKFSITPFAAGVKVLDGSLSSNRNLAWIDKQGENSQHWIAFGGKTAANAQGFTSRFDIFDKLSDIKSSWKWGGCLEGPKYPLNVNDTTPNPSDKETLFVPFLAPDEPSSDDDYGNSYLSDSNSSASCASQSTQWGKLTNVCKYKTVTSSSSNNTPNDHCPSDSSQLLMQLTTSQSTVTNKISNLEEGGNTNLHEGFMWGWRTLSPSLPFAGGRSYNAPKNRKIMVFMTDGYNNWKSQTSTATGSTYQALGYYSYNGTKNERFPDGTNGNGVNYQEQLKNASNTSSSYWDESRNMLDELTAEACANAKADGIEVFTIGFSTPDDEIDEQGLNLLKACATNEDHYFKAENADDLNTAFGSIGIGLGKLRLSK